YKYEFPSYKYFYNASTYPNCIDAAPFYGADGNLYMSYGSWSGGIWLVKLTADGRYLDNGNLSGADAYYGIKIAATSQESSVDGVSGSAEGSFIYYDPESKYYYLTVVYGAVHNYRYTMRVWRSASVTGPYTDATGTASTTASTNDSRSGMKLMGNYNFTGTGTQYYDNGHSSNLIVPSTSGTNEAGKSFIAYHVRMYDGYRTERSYASTNYLNEARVHQVVLNQDGWQCILPYQYSGETFGDDGFVYSMNNLTGTWSFLLHNETIDSSFKTTSSIMLKSDGTVSGNYSGTWQLVMDGTKPYLNMTLNISGKAVTFKGVFVTMTNELGELTTTLSAAGETEGYKTIAWGAMQEALKPASSASDSDLIMMSDDGYDNIIYTHGTNNNGNYGAGSSSDYMWFGDIISDGTVPPTGNATYNYSAKDGVSVANNPGYEQGERATYIYIADKYSITTTAGAITDAEGDKITATQITSDLDGYNKYVLSGSIGDAGAYFEGESDDTKRFKNTTLIVPYTDANGAEYSQHLYATVMPNPVSANAMTAAYNGGAALNPKPREANAFLRADGSTGTVASGTNIGNYAYLDNPVYVGGLCGYAFVNNASNSGGTYLVTGGPNGGGTGVNKAGSFAVLNQSQGVGGNGRAQNVTNSDSAVVTAHYYLDLSKLNDNGTQNIGGLTVNQNDKTLSFNMLGTELNGVDNSQTNRTETFSLTTGTVFSWSSHVSTFSTAANSVNNAQTIASGTTMMYDTSVISASYSSYASAAASANQKLTDTATFKRNHNGTSTPYSNANSVIGIEVNVFDKSAIYDRLGDYKSLIQTDYTEETWEALEEALRNATWYCNNYKLFTYDVNGNVVDPASYMNTLSTELTEAAQALFSFDEFQDFKEIYDLAVAVYDNASDETLTSSTA
ncbi:MAG: glycoside hydrolase family 43 protein, partial [Eubacterium sp.]